MRVLDLATHGLAVKLLHTISKIAMVVTFLCMTIIGVSILVLLQFEPLSADTSWRLMEMLLILYYPMVAGVYVVSIDVVVSTLLVPIEGIRILKEFEFDQRKVPKPEQAELMSKCLLELQPSSLVYMRLVGVALVGVGIAIIAVVHFDV